ncbi:MAG: polyprotein [Grapevine secovirus]|nr:MAG: polyprotein [Grapevine secovirus]
MSLTGTALQVRDFLRKAENRLYWVENARFPPGYTMPRLLMKIPWKGDIFDTSQLLSVAGHDIDLAMTFKRIVFSDNLQDWFVDKFFDGDWIAANAHFCVGKVSTLVVHSSDHKLSPIARIYAHSGFAEVGAVRNVIKEFPNWKFLSSYDVPAKVLSDVQLNSIVERKVSMLARRLNVALNSEWDVVKKVEHVYRHVLKEDLPSHESVYLDGVVDFLDQHRSIKKEVVWSSDVMDVLMKQMRNFYARLVKLDYSLEPNLEKFSDWVLDTGVNGMIKNCLKAMKIYDILLRFVNASIDYLDDKLSPAVKGDVKPVYLRPLQESMATSENIGNIMQDLEMRLKVMEGTISAIESVIVYDKRRDISVELTAERVAEQISTVLQKVNNVRDVLIAGGVKVPKFNVSLALPKLRAFGWVPEVVSQLLSNWQNVLTAISLVDSLIGKLKPGWHRKIPALAFIEDSIESVGASVAVPLSEAAEVCCAYLNDVLGFLKGEQSRAVEEPIQLKPNPDGSLPPQYGFFDEYNPFVTPGTSGKVETLADWVAETGFKKGSLLKEELAKCGVAIQWVTDVRISGKEFWRVFSQIYNSDTGAIHFPKPDAVILPPLPEIKPPDVEMESKSMTFAIVHWKRYIDKQIIDLVQAINVGRERDNEVDKRCALLGSELLNTNRQVAVLIRRFDAFDKHKPGLIIPDKPDGEFIDTPTDVLVKNLNLRVQACEKIVKDIQMQIPEEGILPAVERKLHKFYVEFGAVKRGFEEISNELKKLVPPVVVPTDGVKDVSQKLADFELALKKFEQKVSSFPDSGFDLVSFVKEFSSLKTGVDSLSTSVKNLVTFKENFSKYEDTLKSFAIYYRDVVPNLVSKNTFDDYLRVLSDVQSNANKVKDLPGNFVDSFSEVTKFISGLKEAKDLNAMDNEIVGLKRRMENYDSTGGKSFEARLQDVEGRKSLSEEELKTLTNLPKSISKISEVVKALVTAVNSSHASDPEFRPIAFAEADCFGNDDEDYMINGFIVSRNEWLETLPLEGLEVVYRKKLLAELRSGTLSSVGKEWLADWELRFNKKVVGTKASLRPIVKDTYEIDGVEVSFADWLQSLNVEGALDVKRRRLMIDDLHGLPITVVSRKWIAELKQETSKCVGKEAEEVDVVNENQLVVRQGSIPCRDILSDGLGYKIGKKRVWLTPAECFHLMSHWMISLWIWFCHPNVDFTGEWDMWREEYVQAGKPVLRSVCQADVIEDTKADEPVEPPTIKHIDKQLEYIEQLEIPGNLHANQRVIMAGKNAVSNTTTSPYIVWKRAMPELYSANGPFVHMFGPTGMLQGGLSLHLRLNLTPLAGLGLLIGYAEGGDVGSTMDFATAISFPHVIWNPACEDSCLFEFYVNSCVDHWHPSFLLGHPGILFMMMISNWSPAPPHNMAFSWKISYEPSLTCIRDVITPMAYSGQYRGNWVAMTFRPNSTILAVAEHFNLGYPSLQGGLIYSFWETLIGMHHYWRGDVLMQVHKLSSPMVAGTFGCALVPGLKIPKMSSSYLQSVPHVEFTLGMTECRKKFVFPSHIFGFAGATERMNLNRGSVKTDMAFVVWMLDTPTGNKDVSEYILGFEILGLENCEVMGFNSGYPVTAARFINSKSQSQAPQEKMVIKRDDQSAMAYQVPASMYMFSGQVPAVLQNDSEWFHCLSWTPAATHAFGIGKHDFVMFDLHRMCLYDLNGKSHALVIPSPFVRLMQSSSWIKGRMRFKLVWAAPEVKVADWDSSLRISVYNDEVMSYRRHHHVATTRGGEHVFTIDVGGCFGGFYPQLYHTLIKKDAPQLVVQVIGSKMAYWELYVQVEKDFQVAGVSGSVFAQSAVVGPNPAYDVPIDL